jgi:cell shape-determining protein MreC
MPRGKKKVEKVAEMPDFVRDSATEAIINTNSSAFENRRNQIALAKEKDNRIQQLENDVAELKKLIKGLSKK